MTNYLILFAFSLIQGLCCLQGSGLSANSPILSQNPGEGIEVVETHRIIEGGIASVSDNDFSGQHSISYHDRYHILRNFLVLIIIVTFVFLYLFYKKLRYISKANKQLERQKEHIINVNKKLQYLNSTRDKLFSIISHDLRNPFASIVSFSRILKRDIQVLSHEELQELVAELDQSVNKISYLLDNLLHWSLSHSGKIKYDPGYIAISELVDSNIELFLPAIKEKGITVNNNVSKEVLGWADNNMTDIIIRNLLSNAIKYVIVDGVITIDAEKKNGMVHIAVSDNGVGIHDENKSKLFKIDTMFSTYGTQEEKGSGLGLLLCKEFVEKQGGELWFESEFDVGTTFFFSLPVEGRTKQ